MSVTTILFNKARVGLIAFYSKNVNPYHYTYTPSPRMTLAPVLIATLTVCYVAIATVACGPERLLLGHLWAEH